MSPANHTHGQPRASVPNVRKTAVRAARSVPSVKTIGGPKVAFKVAKYKSSKDEEEELDEDKDDMATSFLQFCAMCEKQIVIPNNAILYCSESCRRKDASQSLYLNPSHPLVSPVTTSPPDTDDSFGIEPRNILPAHLPTPRPSPAARIPPQAHEGKSDLDPTEWKPNLPHRPSSEAFQYLSQFHKSGSSSLTPTRRPAMARSAHSAAAVAITAPELSYTPTASSSSEESVAGTPCEFATRPLLPSAYTLPPTKSIDLVTPHVVRTTSSVSVPGKHAMETKLDLKAKETMAVAHLNYEKKWIVEGKKPAAGGLKKLLDGQM